MAAVRRLLAFEFVRRIAGFQTTLTPNPNMLVIVTL